MPSRSLTVSTVAVIGSLLLGAFVSGEVAAYRKNSAEPVILPQTELTEDVLIEILTAELASQRDLPESAFSAYTEAARISKDGRLAALALETANELGRQDLVNSAITLINELDPANIHAEYARALEMIKIGHWPEAEKILTRILASYERPEEMISRLASETDATHDPLKRHALVKQISEPYQASPFIQAVLSTTASQANLKEQAWRYARRAFETSGETDMKTLSIALRVLISCSAKDALPLIRARLIEQPDGFLINYFLLQALAKAGTPEEFQTQFERVDNLPNRPDSVTFDLGVAAEQVGNLDLAEKYYRRFIEEIKHHPGSPLLPDDAYSRLGMIRLTQGEKEEAVAWFAKVEHGEKYLASRVKQAEILASLGRVEQACSVMKAIDTEKKIHAELLGACSDLLAKTYRYEEAVQTLMQAYDSDPERGEYLYRAAMIAAKADRVVQAEELLTDYIEKVPANPQGYNALGYLWLTHSKNRSKAAEYIEKAMAMSGGKDPYITDSMGWLRYLEGNLREAEKFLREALKARNDEEITLHLAEVLFAAGKKSEAEKLVRNILSRNPGNVEAPIILKNYGIKP